MLELKKVKAELLRVQAAKAEMEYLIEQKMEEINRIEESIKKQTLSEKELSDKLASLVK